MDSHIYPITVLLVDDHPSVRKGLRAFLDTQSDFHVVDEASSGEEAVDLVPRLVPDIVVLDMVMPGMTGIEATSRIKKISPRTQVVILTSASRCEYRLPALKAGATSYLVKDIKMERLANELRSAARTQALHLQLT